MQILLKLPPTAEMNPRFSLESALLLSLSKDTHVCVTEPCRLSHIYCTIAFIISYGFPLIKLWFHGTSWSVWSAVWHLLHEGVVKICTYTAQGHSVSALYRTETTPECKKIPCSTSVYRRL